MHAPTAGFIDPWRLDIAEAQRYVESDHGNGGPAVHGVGGFCRATVITRDSIQTAILHHWPDRLGEKIEPAAPRRRRGSGQKAGCSSGRW